MTFTYTDAGPSKPSLSSGLLRIIFFDRGAIVTGESFSRRDSDISLFGSPFMLSTPSTDPTEASSLARKFSEDPPSAR